ncbi:metalloprotease [Candidatus Woesearchaeota archaeon]|nr:metalloprotease [Candidatus Woesearchaeota archaeon]
MISLHKIKTSKTELIDITKALLAVAVTFAVLRAGVNLFNPGSFPILATADFWLVFVVSIFTAGIGFLLHELAHKVVAQRYGCVAEFRSFDQMLLLALGLALLIGFTFIAPGAVMIAGNITRKENGIVSMAGPMTNYILGLMFLGLIFIFPAAGLIFAIGFQINMWLGLFNMIPFGNFDGIKIFYWSKIVWTLMVAFGIFFVFFFGRPLG